MIGYILMALCNLFLLAVIIQFYDDMFERNTEKKVVRYVSCILWYIFAFPISEIFHSVIANIVVSLIFLIALSMTYEASPANRVVSVFLVGCINSAYDYLSYMLFSFFADSEDIYSISYVGTIVMAMICELLLRKHLRRNKGKDDDYSGMFVIVIIPLVMFVMMLCLIGSDISGIYSMIAGICALTASFVSFNLYGIIISDHIEKIEKESLDRQVAAYGRELEGIEKTELRIEGIRHDLRHHLVDMEEMLKNNELESLSIYISDMKKDISPDEKFSRTGKYEIDSLVNYMIEEAGESLKEVNVKMAIPEDLSVGKYQLNIILGNLLENAIKAAKVSEEQSLKLLVKVEKNVLFIDIDNSYSGNLIMSNGKLLSTKRDAEKHGFGLQNVKRIVSEHDGTIEIKTSDNHFRVRVMMCL